MLAALVLAAEKTPAEEGRDIIMSMLVVGLIFLSVIVVGQLGRWYGHKRSAERARRRRVY
ncbi:MAG: hypothetical protein ACRDM8_08855 [Gaiellaceae bacterium]